MPERLIHPRAFRVSKELNPLDLLCEQRKRQIGSRDEWKVPETPAGKASSHPVRTPSFFAWDQEQEQEQELERTRHSTWQAETPPKVARTLEMTERESEQTLSPERSLCMLPSESRHEIEGQNEDSAIEVDETTDRRSEGATGRTIAVSPIREDILDRYPAPLAPSQNPPTAAVISPSPYPQPPSPRYRHGRCREEIDRFQSCAAGVTTEQADRFRMNRSSGKRLRSPARKTTLWGDMEESGTSCNISTPTASFSHKRQVRSAAERTFGGSSVSRTLHIDTSNRSRYESESQQLHSQERRLDNVGRGSNPSSIEVFGASRSGLDNFRKTKRVSFGGNHQTESLNERVMTYPQPRTLPVLADKTTQTEEIFFREAQSHCNVQENDQGQLSRSSELNNQARGESERPKKVPRRAPSAAEASHRRTSSHLTNPLLVNPRYPPEPTKFQGKSMYSTVFNDRLPWR